MIGIAGGLSQNSGVTQVSSDPNGARTAALGTMVVDASTGVIWQNRSGGTIWDPISIPRGRGTFYFNDLDVGLDGLAAVTTGSASTAFIAPSILHPGQYALNVTAVNDTAILKHANATGPGVAVPINLGYGKVRFRCGYQIDTVSDGTDRSADRVGLTSAVNATIPAHGVWLENSLALNGSNNWFLVTSDNSTVTKTDTGVAGNVAAIQTLEIDINATATSVTARIDGISVATNTTNIPTASGREIGITCMRKKELGSNTRSSRVDWIECWVILSAPRTLDTAGLVLWGDSLVQKEYFHNQIANLFGRSVYPGGVSGETSTQIKTRLLAAPAARLALPTIIWAGRNNFSSSATVQSDIAAMVAALGHTNYLVLNIINSDQASEYSGAGNYIAITALNTALAATYGSRYLAVREALVAAYDPGTPQDVTDHGRDVPPSTLRADFLHPNAAGMRVVANLVYANRALLGL